MPPTTLAPVLVVTDAEAYKAWVFDHHPEGATVTIRIPGTDAAATPSIKEVIGALTVAGYSVELEVKPYLLPALVKGGRADVESGQLWDAAGRVVEGITVTLQAAVDELRRNAFLAGVAQNPDLSPDERDAMLAAFDSDERFESGELDPDPEAGESPPDPDPDDDHGPESTSVIETGPAE